VGSPASARAASGLYLQLGAGYGEWTGSELITRETGENDRPFTGEGCCPSGTLSAQLRLGFSILGIAPELIAFGSGWNLDANDTAGGGFLGGGLRLFPLTLLDALEVIDTGDFPLDVSVGVGGGYAIAGSDAFAYSGAALGVDLSLEYLLTSFLSLGVKTDFWFPSYDAFAVTSWSQNEGRCLDGTATQIFGDNPDNPFPERDGVISRDDAGNACPSGRGPNTTVISPQVVFTFRFDVLGSGGGEDAAR
jgi:hypothetical protein